MLRVNLSVFRVVLVVSLVVALVIEGLFLSNYLPTAREAVEVDGAVMLVLGTLALFFTLWLPPSRIKLRFFLTGCLLGGSVVLFFLAYVLMTRW